MFRHPAWIVGSYSSSPPTAVTPKSRLTGGFYHPNVSPRTYGPAEEIVEGLILLEVVDPLDDAPHHKVGHAEAPELNVLHRQGLNSKLNFT